ncbi:hypothetical protein [Sorangium cellulosum]|uniref:Secreted protein n=3 Tax=Sorangium cellulosum TaxID=56 RepID=A0A150TSR1_SORCE|nr:hypothetical protein [Sorangium cellulosum]AGP33593.1 hypothetical protein SCE1572_03200 [Sorangium cellulosum So0157-2]KYG07732.1 hypothetical protein BE21_27725 [Sorangium cellulosum]
MKITKLSGVFALLLIALAAPGCGKEEQPAEANATVEVTATAESAIGEGAYVEEHESGKAAFNVAADGNVKAVVSGPDGKPIREDVSGTLLWKDASGEKTLPLTLDAKTGLLVAAGPKLEADLTEIGYTLNVAGKPWNGTLHVPAGGTAELYANAKGSADLGLPEGKLGPHGGRIEIVGDDRLELLVDEATGDVRVYVLDADLKPIDIGERKVTLGVVAEAPQVVVLAPVAATAGVAAGAYLTGKLALAADPLKVTVAVRNAGRSAVALCGYRAGAAFAVHARAPRVKVRVKTDWHAHAHAHAHADLKAKADLDPKVHVHTGAGAKAHAKANVNVKAPSVRVTPPSVNVQIKAPSISIPKPSFKASASARASAGAKVGTR